MKTKVLIIAILGIVAIAGISTYYLSSENDARFIANDSLREGAMVMTIVHDRSNPHSLNDEFVPASDAHISVSLLYSPYPDAPSETVLSQDFPGARLPFSFELAGDMAETLKNGTGYYLSAKVFNHAGDETMVGDLLSEESIPVQTGDKRIEIKVFGIEDCSSANAGGFCTTKK